MRQTTTDTNDSNQGRMMARENKVAVALKVNTGVKAGAGGRETPPSGRNHNQKLVQGFQVRGTLKIKSNVKAGLLPAV